MITGRITELLAAELRLEFRGINSTVICDAAIDTGFDGALTLPAQIIDELRLPLAGEIDVTLGDGTRATLATYNVQVGWAGGWRGVTALRVEESALIGMDLLLGCRLVLEVRPNGVVSVEELK